MSDYDLTTRCILCRVFAYLSGYHGKTTPKGFICVYCLRRMDGAYR